MVNSTDTPSRPVTRSRTRGEEGAESPTCALCGLPAPAPLWDRSEAEKRPYCCSACLEVARLLREVPPERAGPTPKEKPRDLAEITLSLGGLWCSSCAWLIELSLRRLPGVHEAAVSFLRREARVSYDPTRLDESAMIRAVRRRGYRAVPHGKPMPDEEEALWTRLLLGGVLAMHVMLISLFLYVREGLGIHSGAELEGFFRWVLLLGSAPLMFVWGLPVARAGLLALIRGRPNLPTLIALGAFAAFALSVRNLVLGHEAVYFDTVVMLLGVVTLGHWLEVRAQRTGKKLLERLRLRNPLPAEARVLTPEGERSVPLSELKPGMRLRVRPGEVFPADGVVAEGRGWVDESLLTGEPLPHVKAPGDAVRAGTRSVDGTFEMVASAVGEATEAGRLTRSLEKALWERAPVERWVDRLAAWLVPLAVATAAGSFLYAWGVGLGVEAALRRALAVLVIACPCALGLATPLALWAALGRASQAGLLIKSTRVVEALAHVKGVVLDKTGTLTESLTLRAVAVADGLTEDEALRRAAAVEAAHPRAREHPLGKAILEAACARGLVLLPARDAQWEPGRGVGAVVKGSKAWVGNRALIDSKGLTVPESLRRVEGEWLKEHRARALLYVGYRGSVKALLALDEALRPAALAVVKELKTLVGHVEVLTGDTEQAAARCAQALNVPVRGGRLPEEKARYVRAQNVPVAVVGDGTNDGPALAAAAVGFTLSRGTEVAHTAADVVLLKEDLRLVPWALRLARATLRRVKQNLGWALVYNLMGMSLAATGNLSPVVAAVAMATSSLLVTTNALRLRRFPLPDLSLQTRSPQTQGARL